MPVGQVGVLRRGLPDCSSCVPWGTMVGRHYEGAEELMELSRISFRIVAALAVIVSFLVLFLRGRPIGGFGGLEPLLFASELTQPRGLAFGPDGALLVAEAGFSGIGEPAVPGQISRLSVTGEKTVLVDDLAPASAEQSLFARGGPAALARAPGADSVPAYVFLGPSVEAPLGALAQLAQVNGQWRLDPLATLTHALGVGPATMASVWSGSLAPDGALLATLPLVNQLVRLQPSRGNGLPVATGTVVTGFVGAGQQNPLPTGVTVRADGSIYVALFGTEPFRPGGGKIIRVEGDGRWQPVYEAFTFPVALAASPDGQLFVLEFASAYDSRRDQFAPNSGRLVAIGPGTARRRTIVREINYPTALAFSPEGDVYFTESGADSSPGDGRVLRVPAQMLRRFR
ncbi:MAG: ScyD/ScyE family protein [Chloroflexi bacterium]|nr:ScyD/ScyE family protein [Chloroflexota bacterium]